ncbi:MAG: TspO/MBR family protein [Candidatus Saccharibacteria bacterium]
MKNFWKLILAIVVCEGAGLIGTIFTTPAIPGWFKTLSRPDFAPPNWLFAPVWTTLFLLMGIAAWLVWRRGLNEPGVKKALGIFVLQLVLNVGWSAIFFGLKNPGLAFVEIILLWLAILWTVIVFARISKPAGWLLLPYIAWVTFASVLNFAIWRLN